MAVAARIGIGLAGAVVTVGLTGCGSDGGSDFADESAKSIMAQAKKDTKALSSVRVSGSLAQSDGDLEIDLATDDQGNCAGTMGLPGGKAEVLSVEGTAYLRGDEAFWRASTGSAADQIVALLGDKWAKMPEGSNDFGELCDLDELFSGDSEGKKKYTKGKETSVGGQDAIEIIVEKGSGDGSEKERAWVATEGKHYLLKVDQAGGDEPGAVLEFSDFNEPVEAEAPAEGEYVDLDKLGG